MTELKEQPIYIAGQEIKVIENPSKGKIQQLKKRKFTGLSFHLGREQPWDAWRSGEIIKFTETKEAALNVLREDVEKRK